jgi:hypothetical protein
MNQDHVLGAAVTGAPSAAVMLAVVIAHFQGVDATTAGCEAGLVVLALGALAGSVAKLPAFIAACRLEIAKEKSP